MVIALLLTLELWSSTTRDLTRLRFIGLQGRAAELMTVESGSIAISKEELFAFQVRTAELMTLSKEELLVLSLPCEFSKSQLLCAVLVVVICDA